MEKRLARLMKAMIEYDKGDVPRIQHFVKVHNFATTIARLEDVDSDTLSILEAASVLHDIGIHLSEAKYGNDGGKHQEELGPAEAIRLLCENGEYSASEIERIAYLIGHHHTYEGIDGMDWQILLEADFLVNSYENNLTEDAIRAFEKKVFKTRSGRHLLETMWGLGELKD